MSQVVAWGGWAWASGGIVSTPGNLNRFARAYVGGTLLLGYTQLFAAKRNGRRSLTFTITSQVSEEILPALRRAQVKAVCAALARR